MSQDRKIHFPISEETLSSGRGANNVNPGDSKSTIFKKIHRIFHNLKNIAFSSDYNDILKNRPIHYLYFSVPVTYEGWVKLFDVPIFNGSAVFTVTISRTYNYGVPQTQQIKIFKNYTKIRIIQEYSTLYDDNSRFDVDCFRVYLDPSSQSDRKYHFDMRVFSKGSVEGALNYYTITVQNEYYIRPTFYHSFTQAASYPDNAMCEVEDLMYQEIGASRYINWDNLESHTQRDGCGSTNDGQYDTSNYEIEIKNYDSIKGIIVNVLVYYGAGSHIISTFFIAKTMIRYMMENAGNTYYIKFSYDLADAYSRQVSCQIKYSNNKLILFNFSAPNNEIKYVYMQQL